MTVPKKLATSGTMDGIKKLICEFYCTNVVSLKSETDKTWGVYTGASEKFAVSTHVRLVKNRYTFETRQ